MRAISYIIINVLLFSAWHIFLYAKRDVLSFIDRLTASFILGLSQIILTELLLGVLFRRLFAAELYLLNISVSSIVFTISLISARKPGCNKFISGIFGELKNKMSRFFIIISKDRALMCLYALFFIAICWMLFIGYLFPSYTWDALWYHLPIVGYIMQSGVIQENHTPFFIDMFINIFPKNIELFFLWNTIFLKSGIISDLSQVFFAVAAVLAIYSMAIKLGLKEIHASYAALLFFFTPVVILQSTTNYVDLAVSALFLIALNFLMCGTGRLSVYPVFLAGLSGGILLGSKGSGPIFIAVISAMAVILLLAGRRGPLKKKTGYPVMLLSFILPVLLMGGYWYIKNWVLYGNPVYPMEVSFLDIKLFEGTYDGIIDPLPDVLDRLSPMIRPFYVWLERVEYYLYDSRLSGFGPLWFILILPSMIAAILYAVKERRQYFLITGAVLFITFIIYPRNWYPRYVIFILAYGTLSFGMTLSYFEERQKGIKLIALLLVIYTFFTANSPCIMPSKIREFASLPVKERGLARLAPFNIDLQARQEYGLWIWIENNMSEGHVLAYTFEPLFLAPLWGQGFSSRIVFAGSDNYRAWINNLRENKVTHILIRQNSREDKWMEGISKRPGWLDVAEQFKVVYSDINYKVLRFY
ncbi:MAG: hypothetical protein HY758_08170 [Nitrospirae bacterium]|nr:hypothetical protein [Nitrospirota bacterium]